MSYLAKHPMANIWNNSNGRSNPSETWFVKPKPRDVHNCADHTFIMPGTIRGGPWEDGKHTGNTQREGVDWEIGRSTNPFVTVMGSV